MPPYPCPPTSGSPYRPNTPTKWGPPRHRRLRGHHGARGRARPQVVCYALGERVADLPLRTHDRRSILEPRFAQLRAQWQRQVEGISAAAEHVFEVARPIKEAAPIAAAAKRVVDAARNLNVEPPPGEWWGTVGGKHLAIGVLKESAGADRISVLGVEFALLMYSKGADYRDE